MTPAFSLVVQFPDKVLAEAGAATDRSEQITVSTVPTICKRQEDLLKGVTARFCQMSIPCTKSRFVIVQDSGSESRNCKVHPQILCRQKRGRCLRRRCLGDTHHRPALQFTTAHGASDGRVGEIWGVRSARQQQKNRHGWDHLTVKNSAYQNTRCLCVTTCHCIRIIRLYKCVGFQ